MTGKLKIVLFVVLAGLALLVYQQWRSGSSTEFWAQSTNSDSLVDHTPWQNILDDYLISDDPAGVNLFDYAGFVDDGSSDLDNYLLELAKVKPTELKKAEQMAYWINLYNALTVQVIVENYPLSSIRDLGTFGTGPWDDAVIVVQGMELTLNDIEHGILRPIWGDFRIHFAVNCASIGCPNLMPEAFTSANTEALLDQGAVDYLGHPRGLQFVDDELVLSSIFDWYQGDFASDERQLLKVLSQYLPEGKAQLLHSYQGDISYDYDWQLNE